MNRQEAIKLDNDIKNKLQKYANDIGIDEKTGSYIVDNYIEIIPDDDVAKGMLFVSDTKITSYKAENFKVDLKKSIIAGLELFASVSMPENIIKYIQLLIMSVLFIEKSMKIELSEIEASIIYRLHMEDSYKNGIEENKFIDEFVHEFNPSLNYNETQILNSLNNLCILDAICIEDGKIYLKEKIVKVI